MSQRQSYPALGWLLQRARWVGLACPSLIAVYKRHAAVKLSFVDDACQLLEEEDIPCVTDSTWLQAVPAAEVEIRQAEDRAKSSVHRLLIHANQEGKSPAQVAWQLKVSIEAVELYRLRLCLPLREVRFYHPNDPLPFPLPPIPTDEAVRAFVNAHGVSSPATFQWLETQFLLLLKMCAIARGPDGTFALDDLVQEGWIGLRSAARNYQPEKGKFHAFAWVTMGCRMRYAVLWWQMGTSAYQRMVKHGARKIYAFRNGFTQRFGRLPTYSEISLALGIPVEDVHIIFSQPRRFSDLNPESHENLVMDKLALSPLQELEQREMREKIADALTEFSEADQLLLLEHFVEGRTIAELARMRGDGEGWLTCARLEFLAGKFKKKLLALGITHEHAFE